MYELNRPPSGPRHRSVPASRRSIAALAVLTLTLCLGAQSPVVLDDGRGMSAVIGPRGIVRMTVDGEVFRFADVDPLVVRVTRLAGGQMAWTEFPADRLSVLKSELRSPESTRATALRRFRIPGFGGNFDVVHEYSLLPPERGRGIAIRGRLERSTLSAGIAAVAYRLYVDGQNDPDRIVGGFTGAIEVDFADLAEAEIDDTHPFILSGGRLTLAGVTPETFLTTRTSETHFVAASCIPGRSHGLMLVRDSRQDPDNTARELGFFGANDVASSPGREFGFGVVSYLPNDDRAGNGGRTLPIGSGVVLQAFPRENAADPYWDVARAYRDSWVDPLLAGTDKPGERPSWMSDSLYMVLNVAGPNGVRDDHVLRFLEEFLTYHDAVDRVALLLWGAAEGALYTPLAGLPRLIQRIEELETRLGKTIRTSMYYLPTAFHADASGGPRFAEVCRDPFGQPLRTLVAPNEYVYRVDVSGAPNAAFFARWLDDTLLPYRLDGVYFDDAFRHRTFSTFHYDPAAAEQGRTPRAVASYAGNMLDVNAHFRALDVPSYLVTELGLIGRSVPGNLVQGTLAPVQSEGPIFEDPAHEVRFRPFLNDVAGHHWICGYSGDLLHRWLVLRDIADMAYFATPVVRGLVPVQSPFPTADGYRDFFQLCRDGLVDCSNPDLRAVGLQSSYANAGMRFLRRHADVLTRWRREPLPGTHDIQTRRIAFNGPGGAIAFAVTTDELPYGCFSAADEVAIAITNPRLEDRYVTFDLERELYGLDLRDGYRVTVQTLQDAQPREILRQWSGDFEFRVHLPSHEFAMIAIEPVDCVVADIPNEPDCDGGTLEAAVVSTGQGHALDLTLTGAPANSIAILAHGPGRTSMPLQNSPCRFFVDTASAQVIAFFTDAQGGARLQLPVASGQTGYVQVATHDAPSDAVVATNALTVQCR